MMQNSDCQRTKEALKLMVNPNAMGVLLLTGTPMKNGKPRSLFPLLQAVCHSLGRDQREYEIQFCDGKYVERRFGVQWEAKGATNLEKLRKMIRSRLLHMSKDACLPELPPRIRVVVQALVNDKALLYHERALQELRQLYMTGRPFLGALQNLRTADSFAKVDATVDVACNVLKVENAVLVFTSFKDAANDVYFGLSKAGWNVALLTSDTPLKKRQEFVDSFQAGDIAALICTYGVGGVGLTLTAAATVILLDRPWAPGDVHQAEDRVRRIGQTKPVMSIWISSSELDRQIDAMIAYKSQTASLVLSDASSPFSCAHQPVHGPKRAFDAGASHVVSDSVNAKESRG